MELLSIIDILRAPWDGYRWLVEQSVTLAGNLFERYGYLVIFLGTCLENTLFLGLIIPGVFVILLAGISAHQGLIEFPLALVIGIVGTSLGDTVSYLAGRFGWKRALEHTEKVPWMGMMRTALLKRTAIFVLAYHFMGYTRLVGPITAGALRIPFARWWVFDFIGAAIWVTTYLSIGYFFGRLGLTLDSAEENVRRLEWVIIVAAVIGILVWMVMHNRSGVVTEKVLDALVDPEDEPKTRPEAEPVGSDDGHGRGDRL